MSVLKTTLYLWIDWLLLKILDNTCRDAHQSISVTRIKTRDVIPIDGKISAKEI